MLGAAYEYLLRQFADESGRKAGEFFTPRPVVHLLVSLLAPQPGETVYDPACGSGGMLVETSNIVQAAGGDTRTLRLYGQEVNATTSAIARMNLFLHDLEDFEIRRDDTLRTPRHLDREGSLQTFDIVIANPPFSMRDWGADSWASDPFQRGFCGTPPAANADFAWVQHMIASMNETGRVGVVMPNGALFRGGAEKTIRRCLIDADLLEAVISLPGNLFYSTTIPACILLFRADKPTTSRGTVVLVDGSDRYDKGRNQNTMTADDLDAVLSATNKRSTTGDVAVRVVSLADIESAGWDLSVGRYLSGAAPDRIDVNAALIAYRTASGDLHNAEDALSQRLRAAGYE
jgi:type I restriction enzyme M protein